MAKQIKKLIYQFESDNFFRRQCKALFFYTIWPAILLFWLGYFVIDLSMNNSDIANLWRSLHGSDQHPKVFLVLHLFPLLIEILLQKILYFIFFYVFLYFIGFKFVWLITPIAGAEKIYFELPEGYDFAKISSELTLQNCLFSVIRKNKYCNLAISISDIKDEFNIDLLKDRASQIFKFRNSVKYEVEANTLSGLPTMTVQTCGLSDLDNGILKNEEIYILITVIQGHFYRVTCVYSCLVEDYDRQEALSLIQCLKGIQ